MTTLDLQVSASADDAHERQDNTDFTSTETIGLWMSSAVGSKWRYKAGMRFQNVTIPPGSDIDVAYISVKCTTNYVDDPNVDIHCEDVDNSANFTSTADVQNRTLTSASTRWDTTGIGTGWVNSPSIVSAVQEVVDRASWSSGNALTVIGVGRSNKGTNFVVWPYDGSSTNAVKLHIEYSSGVREVNVSDSVAVIDTVSKPALDPALDGLVYQKDTVTVAENVTVQIPGIAANPTFIPRQEPAYQVWLDDVYGNRLALLENLIDFEIVRVANAVSYCRVTLPGTFDQNLFGLDYMVEFWRAPVGGINRLETVFFVRKITYTEDSSGNDVIILSGPDANDLLLRRIAAYDAGTSETSKSDYADDMMKEIVSENLASDATDSDRDLSGLNVTVAGDSSLGPGVEKGFAWRNILDTLIDIAGMAKETGTRLYFDMVPVVVSASEIGFDFQTFIEQRGQDRTYDTDNPVMFSKEWGNLSDPELEYDYTEEYNYVYAGGQGEGADRLIEEQEDRVRIGHSVWNRREKFADARHLGTSSKVAYLAREKLQEGKPKKRFVCSLLDTPQARYGVDWGFGDKVEVSYRDIQIQGVISALRLTLDSGGNEKIDAKLDIDL